MRPFEKKYTPTRLQAVYRARFEQRMTLKRIMAKAAAGELVPGDPFTCEITYLSRLCAAEERRRTGRYESPVADKPHRDAIEQLRRGCITLADRLLTDLEARKPKDHLDARARARALQEAIRAVTMASAMPARNEDAPLAPGKQKNGVRPSGRVYGGGVGALLEAARGEAASIPGPDAADHSGNGEGPAG